MADKTTFLVALRVEAPNLESPRLWLLDLLADAGVQGTILDFAKSETDADIPAQVNRKPLAEV